MGRPTPQAMPRTELLHELGDAVIDNNTLAELDVLRARAGEPEDKSHSLEEVLANPDKYANRQETVFTLDEKDLKSVKLQPKEQTKEADDLPLPAQEEVLPKEPEQPKSEKTELEEALKIHKAQLEAQIDAHRQAMELALSRQQAQAPKPEPVQEPDFMRVSEIQLQELAKYEPQQAQFIQMQQMQYRLDQKLQAVERLELQRQEQETARRFDDALAQARTKYEDFDQFMPADMLKQAREISIKSRKTDADFASWLNASYWGSAGPVKHAQAKQQQDELAKKRDEKRQEAVKASAVTAGGGGAFQVPQVPSSDRTMRGGRNEMLAELQALGI